jgi:hypothetical protein
MLILILTGRYVLCQTAFVFMRCGCRCTSAPCLGARGLPSRWCRVSSMGRTWSSWWPRLASSRRAGECVCVCVCVWGGGGQCIHPCTLFPLPSAYAYAETLQTRPPRPLSKRMHHPPTHPPDSFVQELSRGILPGRVHSERPGADCDGVHGGRRPFEGDSKERRDVGEGVRRVG